MSRKGWWLLAAAGAAGVAGFSIYRASRNTYRQAWKNFEKGKAEPIDSPQRDTYFSEALHLFQEIIDKDPNGPLAEEAMRMMGVTYGWLGQEAKALHALEEALVHFPRSAGTETGIYLAQAYQRNGQNQRAYDQANLFLELSGDNLPPENWALRNAYAIKAAAARDLGKYDEATQATEALERLSLESDIALTNPYRL
jgi:tetratricopeptide (TPR) repeat protein